MGYFKYSLFDIASVKKNTKKFFLFDKNINLSGEDINGIIVSQPKFRYNSYSNLFSPNFFTQIKKEALKWDGKTQIFCLFLNFYRIYFISLLKKIDPNIAYGDYSYGMENIKVLHANEGYKVVIGKFCSIEKIKVFIGANHRTDFASTYPFGHLKKISKKLLKHLQS